MELEINIDNEPEPEIQERKERVRKWIFALLFKHGVMYTLAVSIVLFIIYMIGSIPDLGVYDRYIFLLLRLLWYSSLLLCFFSLFAMGAKVRRLVHNPSFRNVLGLFFYFFTGLLGAGLAIINSLIIAASAGNL